MLIQVIYIPISIPVVFINTYYIVWSEDEGAIVLLIAMQVDSGLNIS